VLAEKNRSAAAICGTLASLPRSKAWDIQSPVAAQHAGAWTLFTVPFNVMACTASEGELGCWDN